MQRIQALLLFVAALLGTDSLDCVQSDVHNGIPKDLDLANKALYNNLTLSECANKCCESQLCQAAGIYKDHCINAACKSDTCLDHEIVPNDEENQAEFVFVSKPDSSVDLVTKSMKKGESKNFNITAVNESGVSEDSNETLALKNQSESIALTEKSKGGMDSSNKTIHNDNTPPNDTNEAGKVTGAESKSNVTELASCDPECKENEVCTKESDLWSCTCKDGYISKEGVCIEEVVCDENSCKDIKQSTCTIVDNEITCPCPQGFKMVDDNNCVEVTCEKVPCPVHSKCKVVDNNASCFCEDGYAARGNFCREEIKCTMDDATTCPKNEKCKQVTGSLQCGCIPGKVRAKPAGNCTGNAARIMLKTDDVTVTLPVSSAKLSVAVTPPHKNNGNYFTYNWEQQSSPKTAEKDGSVVAGLTKSQVTVSKLVAGEYVFKVSVTGNNNEYSSKVVKLTVQPEARVNEAPIAVIKPAGNQTFKLPADFSLNGIDSTDDVKIASFSWTIDKKPVASNDHVKLDGEATDTLHVQIEAGEGEFTFKLEVKDEEGLTATANKSVTILKEDDYPPSAKVSAGITITLPDNSAVLSGKDSSDDHGVTRWVWEKSADSPNTGDMTGTTTDTLTLTNLVEGTYTFTLTVYDKTDQKSSATTTITVRPAEKGPPVAEAGDNKELVMPDRATELDGSKSHSPIGELTFMWELIEGAEGVVLRNVNTSMLSVSRMEIGVYRFKLTVTDTTNVTDTDEVTVTVKADDNKPPVAMLGENIVIYAPNTAVDIDGSNSTDDSGIVKWEWTRSLNSPALGQVVSRSNHGPILKLCDLIVGEYEFTLTVYDEKGLSSSASISVSVRSNPHAADIVQVYLFEDAANFTQDRLNSLVRILMVPFTNAKERSIKQWDLVTISVTTIDSKVVVYFYGRDEAGNIMDGAPLVEHLRETVYGKVLGFNFDVIDTSSCSNDCGGHGTCSDDTRLCTCDKFWMENFFRASAGRQFSNCEWSKIYFGIVVMAMVIAFIVVIYTVYCVLSLRNRQVRRRMKYKILEEETGRGVNLSPDSTDDEDSEVFRMRKMRKSSGGLKTSGSTSNGFMPANVLVNKSKSSSATLSNSAKKK